MPGRAGICCTPKKYESPWLSHNSVLMCVKVRKGFALSDESAINRSPLLPDRYPQGDFFVCDIFDAVPKADMAWIKHQTML